MYQIKSTNTKKMTMTNRKATPSSKIMTITPAIAQEFLLKNTNNRPLRKERIDYYLDQMRKGLWLVQNDDICFDWDGNLINGQHRLSAVVKLGKPIDMGVKFGLHPRTFAIMDVGANRSAGDIFSISGVSNGNAKAAITKFYLQFKKGKMFDAGGLARFKMGNNEILSFAEKNLPRCDEVYSYTNKIYKTFKPIAARYLGGLYWLLSDIDAKAANDFFELYGTGIGLTERHPVYILRTKLLSDMSSVKKYPITDKLLWFIMAWNYYRQGRTVTSFRSGDKDNFPKPI